MELRFIQRDLNMYGAAVYQMWLKVCYKFKKKKKKPSNSTQLKKTLN